MLAVHWSIENPRPKRLLQPTANVKVFSLTIEEWYQLPALDSNQEQPD